MASSAERTQHPDSHTHEVPPPPAEGWKRTYHRRISLQPQQEYIACQSPFNSHHTLFQTLSQYLPAFHLPDKGVAVIPGDNLDTNTASTPGMDRAAAINKARVGAQKLWAGTVHIHANAKTGAHHHGHLEVSILLRRARWERDRSKGG